MLRQFAQEGPKYDDDSDDLKRFESAFNYVDVRLERIGQSVGDPIFFWREKRYITTMRDVNEGFKNLMDDCVKTSEYNLNFFYMGVLKKMRSIYCHDIHWMLERVMPGIDQEI